MEDSDEEEDAKPTNGIRDQKGKTKMTRSKKAKSEKDAKKAQK